MIRTLQAISVLSLVLAGLILARCATDGLRCASTAGPAAAPTIIEQFTRSSAGKADEKAQVSPLIREAQAFALYLNPPRLAGAPVKVGGPTPVTRPSLRLTSDVAAAPVKPPASSPKFELHGISYYRKNPDRSMALVLEPGGTRRWVHVGEQLGHLTIERIDCNAVVCQEGNRSQVIALAPDDTVAKYARIIKDSGTVSASKEARSKPRGPEVPPPAPGIRQMPLSRVASLLGQS